MLFRIKKITHDRKGNETSKYEPGRVPGFFKGDLILSSTITPETEMKTLLQKLQQKSPSITFTLEEFKEDEDANNQSNQSII